MAAGLQARRILKDFGWRIKLATGVYQNDYTCPYKRGLSFSAPRKNNPPVQQLAS